MTEELPKGKVQMTQSVSSHGDPAPSLSNLSPARQELLKRRLKERQRASESILPRARTKDIPLSFAQERLWLLDQLLPDSTVFQLPRLLRIRGSLDPAALQRALDALVERHEILRTVYPAEHGVPVQHILPPQPIELKAHDLRPLAENERKAAADKILASVLHRRFALDRDLLIRATYIQLESAEALLLLNTHHIASDGFSKPILYRELAALYEGNATTLQPLPIQYADFAVWQRGELQGEKLKKLLSFWRDRLSGAPELLEFPTDFPRPSTQSYRGARAYATLPDSLTAELRRLSQKESSTLFMTLLAAFKILLYRYSQQPDLVVGISVSGRLQAETDILIGDFANTLPIRTEIKSQSSFRGYLQHVRGMVLEALEHAELPFEKLVEELHPTRAMSHSPIFQVMFLLEQTGSSMPSIGGASTEEVEVHLGSSRHDYFGFQVTESPASLNIEVEYSTDLFSHDTVERLVQHYQHLLQAIVQNPAQQVGLLPLLGAGERERLLVEWNHNQRTVPDGACVPRLFEEQALQRPDAIALVAEDGHLSYAELNVCANQLAHALIGNGIGPGERIGICVERGLEMGVGLLGIMKAGAAYVPLDPALPAERLAFMMADAQLAGLVTQDGVRRRLGAIAVPTICLDRDRPTLAKQISTNPSVPVAGEHVAYVIYTSGSTGRPKGVEVLHRGLANFLISMQAEPGLTADDVLLAVTTLSFDIAGLELYLPLVTGARAVIASRTVASDGMQLANAIRHSGATVMQATPATWHLLLDSGWTVESPLKLLCGGEALTPELARALLERSSSLWNLYGPTETTIWSTLERVVTVENGVSIGRPISNTQAYILDPALQPVPIGAAGELHIGGQGVARGYLGRPDLTAERFIPDPFSNEPGARLYKTGDLARYLPDGRIHFIGRGDNQVKIRGFRIELGEIEATLRQFPDLREAIVLSREDRAGDKRLVAYLLTDASAQYEPGAIREFLRVRLPDYMVPSAFVFLDRFPLNPNGKIDRKALPAPELPCDEVYTAPASPVEQTLATIWAEALGLPRVGSRAHFFDLGGHSLLAAQVVARIREALQLELPIRMVFERPILADLASAIENALLESQDPQEMARLLEELENPDV